MIKLHFVVDRISLSFFSRYSIWLLLMFFTLSCKKPEEVKMDYMFGKWNITKAERNGKETSYLRNGYFIIDTNGVMTINITGEDESGKYLMENNMLIMGPDKEFDIVRLEQDSMLIRYMSESGSQFLFYMSKENENIQ